jgi:hypothetical protein
MPIKLPPPRSTISLKVSAHAGFSPAFIVAPFSIYVRASLRFVLLEKNSSNPRIEKAFRKSGLSGIS